jgi:hypothetical protein
LINNSDVFVAANNFILVNSVCIRKLPYKEALLTRLLISNEQKITALDNFISKLILIPLERIENEIACQIIGGKNYISNNFLINSYLRLLKYII